MHVCKIFSFFCETTSFNFSDMNSCDYLNRSIEDVPNIFKASNHRIFQIEILNLCRFPQTLTLA